MQNHNQAIICFKTLRVFLVKVRTQRSVLFVGTKHRPQQILDLKRAISGLDSSIALLAVSGNHDLGNSPTNETIREYRQQFGDEFYSFVVGGVFYIVINSQCLFDPSQSLEAAESQNKWFEEQLAR